jgi:hypothetical protein
LDLAVFLRCHHPSVVRRKVLFIRPRNVSDRRASN